MLHVNGIIKTEDGYAVKDFMSDNSTAIELGQLSFPTYESAVNTLANKTYPESFRPYLLAVRDLTPTYDTWNNLIFVGHVNGFYDHQEKRFKNARQMDMHAASDLEIAYVAALESTYASICTMVKQ